MFEYQVIASKLSFSNNLGKFEEKLNTMAREGWRVVNFTNEGMQFYAVLERSKNR